MRIYHGKRDRDRLHCCEIFRLNLTMSGHHMCASLRCRNMYMAPTDLLASRLK
jgi:hypothetical protein